MFDSLEVKVLFTVSVRFWPSCVEGMQLLGALRFCRRVDLVGKNAVGLSPGDGEIQTSEQLGQGFTFSVFQHGQCVLPSWATAIHSVSGGMIPMLIPPCSIVSSM